MVKAYWRSFGTEVIFDGAFRKRIFVFCWFPHTFNWIIHLKLFRALPLFSVNLWWCYKKHFQLIWWKYSVEALCWMRVCKLATYFSGKQNGDVFCVIHLGILACTFISPRPKQMGTVYLFIQIGKCSSAKLWFGLILRHRFKAIKDAFQLVWDQISDLANAVRSVL